MRITIVVPFVNLTGGIRFLFVIANYLFEQRHDVTIVSPVWPYKFHHRRSDQLKVFWKQLNDRNKIWWFPLKARFLEVPVISNPFLPDADVVLATTWPTAYDVARLKPSKGKKIHLVMQHESGTGPEPRIRKIYNLPYRRITMSEYIRDELMARFNCKSEGVVPCGVDGTMFYPDGKPEPDTAFMIYHPLPHKGADDGLKALSQVKEKIPGLRLRICGTVMPHWLPEWVSFDFHPTDSELRKLYSTSSIFLYPSRYEGFGLPPLEAMACGCPVVTTAVGATPEFAKDSINAMVVPPRDSERMAEAILKVLSDRELRTRLRINGFETVREYTPERSGTAFEKAIMKLI